MQDERSGAGYLLLFLILAFGWTWFFWVPVALEDSGIMAIPDWLAPLVAGGEPAAWGPLIAAIIVAVARNGMGGLKSLALSMVKLRFAWWWYLIAIALLPAIVGLAQLIAGLAGEQISPSPAFAEPLSIPIAFVFIFFLAGPLQEEAGWRGTSTPILQTRLGALLASLATGILWALWHLPLFFQTREEVYYNQPFWGLLISTTLLSVLHTWIYNSTRRSLFAAMLMHTSWNWSNYLFTGLNTDTGGLAFLMMLSASVILVIMLTGPRTLSRNAGALANDDQS